MRAAARAKAKASASASARSIAAGAFVALAAAAAGGGCRPDLGAPLSLVSGPRILAVRGAPAEAAPGTDVAYDALAVDTAGTMTGAPLGWSLCHVPKPPAEANAVSAACLSVPDEAGPAATFTAPMPVDPFDACQFFGPVPREAPMGQPAIRPRDPDVTGGFYQPVRVTLPSPAAVAGVERAFLLERIRCNLGNAPREVVATFNETYTLNANPALGRVTLDPDGQAAVLFEASATPPDPPATAVGTAAAGQDVTLEAAWPDSAAESYPVWNPAARALETRREALRVSWFATAGEMEHEATGRGEQEPETTARNVWTAPATPGLVHLWAVMRDSRGGVDFAAFDVMVAP